MFAVSALGVSRYVFLVHRWAIKIPRVNYGWRLFLQGLLANMQERAIGRNGCQQMCPVTWSIPGGWLLVMRRATVLTDAEFDALKDDGSLCQERYAPAEMKSDSFGWLDGRLVAVDYGN